MGVLPRPQRAMANVARELLKRELLQLMKADDSGFSVGLEVPVCLGAILACVCSCLCFSPVPVH